MKNTCFVYVSRYGTTKEIAGQIAMVAGPAVICTPDEFDDAYRSFDFFILAAPVYKEAPDQRMTKFIEENCSWLKEKKVAMLCVSLVGSEGKRYLEPWADMLDGAVVWQKSAGGRVRLSLLQEGDYEDLRAFEEKMEYPVMDADFYDREQIMRYAMEIRSLKHLVANGLSPEELRGYIDKYLVSHNTCALATSAAGRVRVTPLEYMYDDGCMYMLSEGGEKFAQIMIDSEVSVCVYDEYSEVDEIGGIQMQGKAFVVTSDMPEFKEILDRRKLDIAAVEGLPFKLYGLKIVLLDADFLWHGFGEMGFDIQQHYKF